MKHVLPAALFAVLCLSGCQTPNVGKASSSFSFDPPAKSPKNPSALQVKISTGAQRLYVVEQGDVLLATPVTVGKSISPTPHGTFKIYSKQATRRRVSQPGAGYPMAYWMEFQPAYGMHWGFVKPYPNTMGCVRMPLNSARKVFEMVPVGTTLQIAASQPYDETHGKSLPVLDDSPLPNPPLSYLLSPQVFIDAAKGKLWNFK